MSKWFECFSYGNFFVKKEKKKCECCGELTDLQCVDTYKYLCSRQCYMDYVGKIEWDLNGMFTEDGEVIRVVR